MRYPLTPLLVFAGCLPAQDGWKDLTGKPMLELTVTSWLNTGDKQPTTALLKGKVWLLEFFATT